MGKLWMFAWANIKKTKPVSITLVIMFAIAALMINAGLLVFVNYGSFFKDLKSELNSSDAYYFLSDNLYDEEIVSTFFTSDTRVKKAQTHSALSLNARVRSDATNKDKHYAVVLFDMDEARDLSQWKAVSEHLPAEDRSVYVPAIFGSVDGYQPGDEITLKYDDWMTGDAQKLTFVVGGYTEDVFFSGADTGLVGFYLPERVYQETKEILDSPAYHAHIVFANVDEIANVALIEGDLRDKLGHAPTSLMIEDATAGMMVSIDVELIGMARTMMGTMISMMMVMFAAIIVIVCLLVAHFRIVNSVEEDALKIGSLKSIGYTSKQIITSIMLQFLVLAVIGSTAGIALSYPLLPYIAEIFERQSGLRWEQGFDFTLSVIASITLICITALVVVFAARHIRRLSPINVLRGETSTQSYRRNILPLDKSLGSPSIVLGLKSTFQHMRQTIMIFAIMMTVTFAGAYGTVMYYNTSVDTKAFAEVPGMEITNAIAVINPDGPDPKKTIAAIERMDGVRKIMYYDDAKVKIGETEVIAFITDDYSKKETESVYEGLYPTRPGEIALAGIVAERIGKEVGDTVAVSLGDNESTLTIVGLSQGMTMGGNHASLTAEDYKKLVPGFEQRALNVYLEDGVDTENFIKTLKREFSREELIDVANFDELMADGMSSYQSIIAAMGIAILVITICVIALVLYFVISSSIIRKRRELGVYKAIGFSTVQLMSQFSIGFMIPAILGAAVGSVLGAVYTNPLMTASMRGANVMKTNFIVDPVWIAGFCIATIIFSYALSLLITWRIRKISAYALVTE